MGRRQGFSLRELFVVLVVVSILAAIAIPAYINAQVRTKLVAMKQENRNVHDAISRYQLDNGDYPIGTYESPGAMSQSSYPTSVGPEQRNSGYRLIVLTTPYPYLNRLPDDPFQVENSVYDRKYMYYRPKLGRHAWMSSRATRLWETEFETVGAGPDGVLDTDPDGPDYDPSNGLFSSGDVHYYGPDFLESNPITGPGHSE